MQEQFSSEFVQRFQQYVPTAPSDACWDWQGSFWKSGYGVFYFKGQRRRAHRVAYEIWVGSIPNGLWVNHSCDRPCCVNPAHLWIGDAKDGIGDCARKGRKTRGEGHPSAKLTEDQVLEIRRRMALRKHGHGSTTLAKEFGVHPTTILKACHGGKWAWLSEENKGRSAEPLDPCVPQIANGVPVRLKGRYSNRKLTEETVQLIRCLHRQGLKGKEIAARCSVKEPTVYAILTGRSWYWLPEETSEP